MKSYCCIGVVVVAIVRHSHGCKCHHDDVVECACRCRLMMMEAELVVGRPS